MHRRFTSVDELSLRLQYDHHYMSPVTHIQCDHMIWQKIAQNEAQFLGSFLDKKIAPKASKNRPNGEKSPNLVTLLLNGSEAGMEMASSRSSGI